MKFRSNFFLLIFVIFLSACGKETAGNNMQDVNVQGQPVQTQGEQTQSGQSGVDEPIFYTVHEEFEQDTFGEVDRQISYSKYLLTKDALYVVGNYSIGVEEETKEGTVSRLEQATVMYRVDLSTKESRLLGEYPKEMVLAMCEGEEGTIAAVMARSVLPEDGSREMQTEYVLRIVDGKSGECEEFNFTPVLEGVPDFGFVTAIAINGDELAISDLYAKTLCVLNYREGTLQQAFSIEGRTEYLGYRDDGTLYVVQSDGNGTLYLLTPNGTVLTKQAEGLAAGMGMEIAYECKDDILYIGAAEGVYAYDMTSKETTKLFSCGNCDILIEGEFQILPCDDAKSISLGDSYGESWKILTVNADSGNAEICTLSKTAPDGNLPEEKEVIVLSNFWSYPELQQMVTAFNKSSDKYRVEIEVAPFSQDYETYIQNRNMEVLAGEGPDLFSVNGSEYQTYAEGGYLVDLMPYMQKLDDEAYLTNVLYGEERGGKCYAAVTSFQIHLAIGRSDIIGERDGWTFEEMSQVLEDNPQIEALLPFTDEVGVLQYCYLYGGIALDDYEALRDCILFAEKYGVNMPLMEAQLGENVLLQEEVILTPRNLQYLMEVSDKYVMVGYPNKDRNGIFRGGSTWSINANSKHIEGAWEFIEFLLTDYQYNEQDMPVLKEAYDAKITAAMTPNTYMEYNVVTGEEIEVEEPYSIWNGVPLYAMTEEQIQAFHDLVGNCNATFTDFDWAAWNIISEEAGAYFNGDKPLDEVIRIIEGRMHMYISEKEG